MTFIDWIENNKEKLFDGIKSNSIIIDGVNLSQYKEDIKNVEEFKNKEIVFLDSPQFHINNRTITVGTLKISFNPRYVIDKSGTFHEKKDRDLKWIYERSKEDEILYLYGLEIFRDVNVLFLRYAITMPEIEYIKNKKRTELIDKIIN
jgi:hypothetical protein